MKRVGLFGKLARDRVGEIVRGRQALLERCYDVQTYDLDAQLPADIDIDVALVFGGDGTILQAARYLATRGIPAIGVNLGKFGFLAGCAVGECPALLEAFDEGTLPVVSRMMLACTVVRGDGSHDHLLALNDIVVTASIPTRMIGLRLSIDGSFVASLQGDGIIAASATGSTAYNLSSGGPIVTPEENVLILTALAPHTLAIRPMVIAASHAVDIEVNSKHADVAVTADGQVTHVITDSDLVHIEQAPYRFNLYEAPGWSFFKVLRDKLRWGEEPNYARNND